METMPFIRKLFGKADGVAETTTIFPCWSTILPREDFLKIWKIIWLPDALLPRSKPPPCSPYLFGKRISRFLTKTPIDLRLPRCNGSRGLDAARIAAVGTLVLTSCSTANLIDIPEESALSTDTISAIRLWNKSGIENYRYRFRYIDRFGCESPEVVVSVHDNNVTSMVFGESKSGCHPDKEFRLDQDASDEFPAWKVDAGNLFVRALGMQKLPESMGIGELMRIRYHPEYGFPVIIAFDVPPGFESLEDNRFIYRVTRFEIQDQDGSVSDEATRVTYFNSCCDSV